MIRFLDWLDEAAGGFIRLAYLAAGITAVALYFGVGHLPGVLERGLNAALPWTLAAAIETHTYSTARRVRAAWQDGPSALGALKVNLAILAGLLAFSSWNQLNYLYLTWTPPHTALALPGWIAYLIRALIIPCAFMAAAFMAPLAPPINAQLEVEARATLADVFRIARKQRRRRLKDAERSGRDMTAALVDLVPDPDARRIIAHAYRAIGAPITSQAVQLVEDPSRALVLVEDPRPPTGPGTPVALPGGSNPTSPAPERRRREPALALVNSDAGTRRRRVRTASAEVRVRALLTREPGLSAKEIARRLRISDSTASKYRRLIESETEERVELAQ
jgi:hypothetical protein